MITDNHDSGGGAVKKYVKHVADQVAGFVTGGEVT